MESKYLYLILDILTISIPFIASFYKKASFYKEWKNFFPAMTIVATIFIVWDAYFTAIGVWGFNPKYLMGLNIFHLPIEEWLFFICVPYACTFTYFAFKHLFKKDYLKHVGAALFPFLIFFLLTLAVLNNDKWYTASTFFLLSIFLIVIIKKKPHYTGTMLLTYLVTLIPFFIVNGILTGTGIEEEVVWYNNNENLALRMGTIPIEDAFYGMLLIMSNISLFEFFRSRNK